MKNSVKVNVDNSDKTGIFGGAMFCELLFLLFLGLKLGNVIDWSWWWVFAPLWLPVVAVAIIVLICVIVLMATKEKK